MSGTITGELRAAMNVDREYTMGGDVVARTYCMGRDKFTDLCDAIDAVHANLERENASLKAELDRVLGEQEDRDGWVELPKDADGEYVCIGDVMEWPTTGETFEVVGIGDGTLFYIEDGNELADWTGASTKRHHVPDTWERIIRDAIGEGMARQRNNDSGGCRERANPMNNDALVARCRALAGDAS